MRIAVLIKQVPETTNVQIDPETGTLCREGVDCIMNPFDTYALEEAVRIKERLKESAGDESEVIVVSMGPPQAEDMLREAISLGADRGVLVTDRAFAGSDTWATSLTLSAVLRKLGCDLVLCGKQAIDGDTAQVGPGIATHLDIPQATYVRKIDELTPEKARVQRLLEEGTEVVELPLPALLTVVKEINEPRLPSLRGKMKAKKAEIEKMTQAELGITPEELGLKGSPTRVMKVFAPEKRAGGVKWEGEPDELVKKLAEELGKRQLV
ncbi:MAG: electron transfer flavoprotein subunit beta/FixA family protein [Planctomycetota bacterium]